MAKPDGIADYILTGHCRDEMERRGISEEDIRFVLTLPQQRAEERPGRDLLQSKIQQGGVEYLLRVFVDIDRHPAEVVTVYRTSKISKYWRAD